MLLKMEVAAGLEPAKTGFADQRLDRFGIATKNVYTRTVPILVRRTPLQSLFTPIQVQAGFADLCLITWRPRLCFTKQKRNH
jgi:hypothetical protein